MLAVQRSSSAMKTRFSARTAGGRRRCGGRGHMSVEAGMGGTSSTADHHSAPFTQLSNGNGRGSSHHSQLNSEFAMDSLASSSTDPHHIPEVVWGPGKSADQIAMKLLSLTERQRVAIAARIDPATYSAVRMHAPGVEYNARARTLKLKSASADQLPKQRRLPGSVAVVSADTADQAIAEEVRVLCDYMGAYCFAIRDVGAANLHGLLANVDSLRAADVVVVVAGTDCALPSLVAGVTQCPVVAVPTSAGFGAALGGMAPLLASLSANTPGIALCNIDNGYGAAAMAVRMLKMASRLHAVRSAAEAAAAAAAEAAAALEVPARSGAQN
ncbi:hypothetical protein PLESTB_001490100 [Pleodorina starrii]|uniref:phosphoribosylaminoimidazole carboxylase n=1 Tax=Pleodorina starrii TaxID=330485 RepID=A0A9W6BWD6_9CHLO|nr:hypothetical protein PLESTM_001453600 [Pleodorina starrii]GLC59462.1 hypothetical protein PLESTB_001490100 [Pleodorina starrii]GLC66337.1 hypothetical protein PLESTF_000413000 [Pleodorina starrii]